MKVDRRWLGTSVVRIRVLGAGLLLLAAGCMVLGWESRSGQPVATADAPRTTFSANLTPVAGKSYADSTLSSVASFGTPVAASSMLSGLPLIFEPNQGQANLDPTDPRARFIARGSGYSLFLGSEGAIVNLRSQGSEPSRAGAPSGGSYESFRLSLAGASPLANLAAAERLPGKSNYLLGNDPSHWRCDIPQFSRIRYENIYPGIGLVFYGNQGSLEYDFQVAPGADPAQAELKFDRAKALELNDGALVIKGQSSALRLEAPRVYQEIAGTRHRVDGHFVLRGPNRAGFAVGAYDHTRELVIDPVLSFSSYFGGTGNEQHTSVAVDGSGNIYLAGSTTSATLPVGASTAVFQSSLKGTQNVYIAKINPVSNPPVLEYVTYLGGEGTDTPVGIAVDGAGDPFVAGSTTSQTFPTTPTAYQTATETASGTHVFVSELNPTASSLLYSSYLSGNGNDTASGMTVDSSGNVYVTGTTFSKDVGSPTGSQFPSSSLPYATPFQSTPLASPQFFVTRVNTFNAGKGSIAYSTYFGGAITANGAPISATGGGIAVDTNGNIYFDGTTNFTYTNGEVGDFPILDAYQPCLNQPPPTVVTNPPTCTNAATSTPTDAFVAKINPNAAQGAQLQWSTFLGGAQTDTATGIALDSGAANVYIVGTTNSQPITSLTTGFQVCLDTPVNPATGTACPTISSPAPNDAFVARLTNPTSSTTTTNMALTYFSYLGGSADEEGLAITVDSANGAIVTGSTQSGGATATAFPVFPSPGNIQGNLTGKQDAFIARLNTAATTGQNRIGSWATYFGGTNTSTAGVLATTEGTGLALDVLQNSYVAGDSNAIDLQAPDLQTANAGGFDAFVTELRTAASVSIQGVLTLGTNQTYISAGTPATFTYTLTNNGPDLATNITVSDNVSQSVTGVALSNVTASSTSGTCSSSSSPGNSIFCNIPSLQAGLTAIITINATPAASNSGTSKSFNGGAVQVTGPNNILLASTQVSAQMSDFTISVTPPDNSVNKAGDTAFYQVQISPHPVYGTSIALACSGLPQGAACAFTPGSVTLQGSSPGSATLALSTQARPITAGSLKSRFGRFYAVWFVVPGLAVLGIGSDRRRRVLGVLMLCILLPLLLLQPACGSTSTQQPVSGTPAGTYSNITVTATAGSDVKSQTIQLTVP